MNTWLLVGVFSHVFVVVCVSQIRIQQRCCNQFARIYRPLFVLPLELTGSPGATSLGVMIARITCFNTAAAAAAMAMAFWIDQHCCERNKINQWFWFPSSASDLDRHEASKKCANARSDWLCSFNIVAFIHLYTTWGGGAPLDPKKGVVQCGGFTWGNPIMAYNFQLLPPINPTISNEFKLPCLQTRHHRCLHRWHSHHSDRGREIRIGKRACGGWL